jgi:hypothetical protein
VFWRPAFGFPAQEHLLASPSCYQLSERDRSLRSGRTTDSLSLIRYLVLRDLISWQSPDAPRGKRRCSDPSLASTGTSKLINATAQTGRLFSASRSVPEAIGNCPRD